MASLKAFTFYWKNGKKTQGEGRNQREAFTRSGYPETHLRQVAHTKEGNDHSLIWDRPSVSWKPPLSLL